MAMLIEGGVPNCVCCGSGNTVKYIKQKGGGFREICYHCNTDQEKYNRERMVENLLAYGFKEVKQFEKPTLYQKIFGITPKQLESYYVFEHVIAKHRKNSVNMILAIGDETLSFNHHGSFKYVKQQLDRIIMDKKLLRKLKLQKIKESCQ